MESSVAEREGRGKQQSSGRWPPGQRSTLSACPASDDKGLGPLERHRYICGPPFLPTPLFPINDGTPCWHVL